MQQIVLQGGDVALVDDDDFPLLSRFKCSRCGVSGEENFDWQGYCLMCEDDDGNDCMQLDQYEDCEL